MTCAADFAFGRRVRKVTCSVTSTGETSSSMPFTHDMRIRDLTIVLLSLDILFLKGYLKKHIEDQCFDLCAWLLRDVCRLSSMLLL